jgi:hypothetical protein
MVHTMRHLGCVSLNWKLAGTARELPGAVMRAAQGAMGVGQFACFPRVYGRDRHHLLFPAKAIDELIAPASSSACQERFRNTLVQKIISSFVSGSVWPACISAPRDDFRHLRSVAAVHPAGMSCATFQILGEPEYAARVGAGDRVHASFSRIHLGALAVRNATPGGDYSTHVVVDLFGLRSRRNTFNSHKF